MSDQINTGIGRKKKKRSQSLSYKEESGGGGGGGGRGGHYHKQLEGLGGVLCHSSSYVTTSKCARSLCLNELSD